MGGGGDFLQRALKTAGQDVDLNNFRDHGVVDKPSRSSSSSFQAPLKRRKTGVDRRRPIRIGLDVSILIHRVSRKYAGMLVDERHLSNYGRALLLQQQGAERRGEHMSDDELASTFEAAAPQSRIEYIQKVVGAILEQIEKLQQNSGGHVLVVLDGKRPPAKKETCKKRSERSKEAIATRDAPPIDHYADKTAESPQSNVNNRLKAARRAGPVDSFGDIVAKLIEALRERKISFIVAPYEADTQLTFFNKIGMIDLVVTEDGDFIAHGCESILYKAYEDPNFAKGKLIQRSCLVNCKWKYVEGVDSKKVISLQNFSDLMIAVMFCIAGCDYCSNLPNVGIIKSRDIVRNVFATTASQGPLLPRMFKQIYEKTSQKDMSDEQKAEYEANFLSALIAFRHPVVYDPVQGRCVLLLPPGIDTELMNYPPYAELCMDKQRREQVTGALIEPASLATHIAEGWIDPRTIEPYQGVQVPSCVQASLRKEDRLDAIEEGDDEEKRDTDESTPEREARPTVHFETQPLFTLEDEPFSSDDKSDADDIVQSDDEESVGESQAYGPETQAFCVALPETQQEDSLAVDLGAETQDAEELAETQDDMPETQQEYFALEPGSDADDEDDDQVDEPTAEESEKQPASSSSEEVPGTPQQERPGRPQQETAVWDSSDDDVRYQWPPVQRPRLTLGDSTQDATSQSQNTSAGLLTSLTSSSGKAATQPSQLSQGSHLSESVRDPTLL